MHEPMLGMDPADVAASMAAGMGRSSELNTAALLMQLCSHASQAINAQAAQLPGTHISTSGRLLGGGGGCEGASSAAEPLAASPSSIALSPAWHRLVRSIKGWLGFRGMAAAVLHFRAMPATSQP